MPLDSLIWELKDTIAPPQIAANGYFGSAIALDGETLLVGATQWFDTQAYYGAEIYIWSGGSWYHKETLKPELTAYNANYARDVALDGDIAVVAAPTERFEDKPGQGGEVFVFQRLGGPWSLSQELTSTSLSPSCNFGVSVALYGDVLLVGTLYAPCSVGADPGLGAVYTFARNDQGEFVEAANAVLRDEQGTNEDEYGSAVALHGDTAVVGAAQADYAPGGENGAAAGAVYVYRWTGNTGAPWSFEAKLFAGDPVARARFGQAVAISGNTLIAGAITAPTESATARGAAYVFVRTEAGWKQEAKLTAATELSGDSFGKSVAIRGDLAVVGAPGYGGTDNQKSGAAYFFARSAGQWTQIAEFQAPDTDSSDEFGADLALESTVAVVGAPYFDFNGTTRAGSAYSFSFLRSTGVPCQDKTECETGHCVDGVCCDSECGGGDPTDCQSCIAARGATKDGDCTLTTVVCRPAREGALCDAPEYCDGESVVCPDDVLAGATVECRAALDSCDLPELCTLGTDQCPADRRADNGAACENASPCFEGGTCNGGACSGGSYVLAFDPPSLSIYTVQDPKIATQLVENKGTLQTVTITAVSTSPADLFELVSPTEWPVEIGPGKSASLQIRFVPTSAGTKTGTLYLDLAGCEQKILPLIGIAENDPVSRDAGLLDSRLASSDGQVSLVDAGGNGNDGAVPGLDGGAGDGAGDGDGGGGAGVVDAAAADGASASGDASASGADGQGQQPDSVVPGTDGGLPTDVDAAAPDADKQGVSESGDSGCNCSVGRPSN
ncbi:MAG: hypothetical protein V2A73_19345, partial [Pseudomonadota bacterium]